MRRSTRRLARADAAWRTYRHTTFADRARWLAAAAEILESETDRLGRIMTLEMGKTIGAARAEAAKCALACRYYAEHGERLLADETVDAGGGRSFIRYQPIGPVLAVMPWNFPFWQVFRFAAPALMAGNVGLLKHASNVPQCALAIEDIIRRAGFPPDVFQTLLIGAAPGGARARRPARESRHAHRQRARRRAGGRAGGPADQEDRARTGRQRSFRRDAQRRPRPRRRAPRWRRAPSTTASPASPPSASSWTRASPPSSSARFVAGHGGAARRRPHGREPPRSARWRRRIFSKGSTSRCGARWRWARAC